MGHLTLLNLKIIDCGAFYEVAFYLQNIKFIHRYFFDRLNTMVTGVVCRFTVPGAPTCSPIYS
jgi:hypothetical protein